MDTHLFCTDKEKDLDKVLNDIQDFFQHAVVTLADKELPLMSVRVKHKGNDVIMSIILHTEQGDREVGIPELVATVYEAALS